LAVIVFCILNILHFKAFTQNFGCYSIPPKSELETSSYLGRGSIGDESVISEFFNEKANFYPDTSCYFKEYYFTLNPDVRILKEEGPLVNGKKEGYWTFFNITEKFYISGKYINDKKTGVWAAYYITEIGDTINKELTSFEDDVLNGQMKVFYFNGNISFLAHYKNGVKHGKSITYWFNYKNKLNLIYREENYSNGIKNGEFIDFNVNCLNDTARYLQYKEGKLSGLCYDKDHSGIKSIFSFDDDNNLRKLQEYHSNGALHFEIEYKNNLPFNLISNNDSLGLPYDTCKLINGTGTLNLYYSNGQLFSSFQYINQIPKGNFVIYYENGAIREIGEINCSQKKVLTDPLVASYSINANEFAVRQFNRIEFDNYLSYNSDSTLSVKIFKSYVDSLSTYAIIYEYYDNKHNVVSKYANISNREKCKEITYYPNNQIKSIENYTIDTVLSNGKKIMRYGLCSYYYLNCQIKVIIDFLDSHPRQEILFYDESGNITRRLIKEKGIEYNIFMGDTVNRIDENGLMQGKWISFGVSPWSKSECYTEPDEIMYYNNNKPCGTWEVYHTPSNGKRYLTESIFWHDENLAYFKEYFDGRLYSEGYKYNQLPDGEWKYYHAQNGRQVLIGMYFLGQRHGAWKYYSSKGKLKRIEYYEYNDLIYLSDNTPIFRRRHENLYKRF